MSFDWTNKRVLLTGGAGFLGSFVAERLAKAGCREVFIPRSREFNLTKESAVVEVYKASRPDIVLHLAASVGGIGANRDNPGKFFYENAAMGINLIEQARHVGVEKFVCVGTTCSYPKFCPIPFREADLWEGYPEETNAPYGIAKKALLVMLQGYREQYGLNGVYLVPVNLYGPRDNFDPASSHVIPALIRKCVEAIDRNDLEIVCWGTGSASRQFLHAEDAADGVMLAAEKMNTGEPVNLATGDEITIKNLVELIVELSGFGGRIIWDATKPDGQPRRKLDNERAEKMLGFYGSISFREGLKQTIDWYRANRK